MAKHQTDRRQTDLSNSPSIFINRTKDPIEDGTELVRGEAFVTKKKN